MPGFYADGEYDLAGFIVGVVDRDRIVDGRSIAPGDSLVGLPSAGLHTNGYSLARRVLFEISGLRPDSFVSEIGATVADALLAPHRSYLREIKPLLVSNTVKGMAHITGGGMTENVPRVLPAGYGVVINRSSWRVPPIFSFIQERGRIATDEMFRAFNMGIGLVVICSAGASEAVLKQIPEAVLIGEVVAGEGVRYR